MSNKDFTIVLDESDYNELQRRLNNLEKTDKSEIIKTSLKLGIDLIKNEGKKNLISSNHKKTGNLLKSLSSKVLKSKSAAYAGFKRSAPNKKIGGANHAHLVDRGTDERWTITNRHYTGSVSKGNPNHGSLFWTKAVTTKGEEARENLLNAIYNSIDKIMNRN